MTLDQTLTVGQSIHTDHVAVDDFVTCGPVQAVWRVLDRSDVGDRVTFTLGPVDPHTVPLDATTVELPRPIRGY